MIFHFDFNPFLPVFILQQRFDWVVFLFWYFYDYI